MHFQLFSDAKTFCPNSQMKTDFGLMKFAPADKAAFDKKRESELMNGRLAMMAVGGIATQSVISGHGFPYV